MSKTILIIDRDPIRQSQLSAAVSKEGFAVMEFESGKEALDWLLFNSTSAVLLDYGSSCETGSPVPAGKKLVQEIVSVDAFVPLMLICDRGDVLGLETSAAADLVVRRPITARQIAESLQMLLGETLRQRAQRKSGYIFAFR